ncbi:FliI/YscN family ATPase [Brucella intermedia]|uniref:FliI/YscN family ATPase n=1 Tax=Brucella intermedia TaxID=94625 RepID=UPI0023630CE0|nr:FliI/YscN family ATPase [Brucella intermedia]
MSPQEMAEAADERDRVGEFPTRPMFRHYGRITRSTGSIVRATGSFCVGEICAITRTHQDALLAEVVGFDNGEMLLVPYGSAKGISYHSVISSAMREFKIPVGDQLVGRVLDAWGKPIDAGVPIDGEMQYPVHRIPPNPMSRPPIDRPFITGIRALDGVLTFGQGQRVGIFAAAGGGKSTLIASLVKNAIYDCCVVALIGERGREVREFVDLHLGSQGMARSVVVIATSDRPAIEQVKAAHSATAIAEFFRDEGRQVLLIMDSLTRFSRAQRQIGLSAGEPPTRRGFPPSVFEQLPALLERTGNTETGSITAIYTVLVEGDDMNEPVADEARSLLDGHIILSRKLAGAGHYPAIDVVASASRVVSNVADADHLTAMRKLRALISKYDELELLVRIGEYVAGSDPEGDDAVARIDAINGFLRQDMNVPSSFEKTILDLKQAVFDA